MRRKRLATAAVVLLVVAAMSFGSQVAFAAETDSPVPGTAANADLPGMVEVRANTTDTQFAFLFSASGTWWQTGGRAKEDATSMYVAINQMEMDVCRLYVEGSTSLFGPWANCTSYRWSSGYGSYALASSLGEFQIWNYVNETGRTYARLAGYAYSQPGIIAGLWSPDSWGSYPIINQ